MNEEADRRMPSLVPADYYVWILKPPEAFSGETNRVSASVVGRHPLVRLIKELWIVTLLQAIAARDRPTSREEHRPSRRFQVFQVFPESVCQLYWHGNDCKQQSTIQSGKKRFW